VLLVFGKIVIVVGIVTLFSVSFMLSTVVEIIVGIVL
jgi:hypothetical protein